MRHESLSVVIAIAPERRRAGTSGREGYQSPRPHKLTPEQCTAIRCATAGGRSLRRLAAEYDVSYETIRAVLSERDRKIAA
jgi:hypothetical protein